MATITIDVLRKADGAGVLDKLEDAIASPPPHIMDAVAEHLHGLVMSSFEFEGDPYGKPWAPHSATTLELKEQGGLFGNRLRLSGHAAILQDRGTLRRGITPSSTPTTANLRVTGPAKKYAAAQFLGNPENRLPNHAGGRKAPIPARNPLPIRNGKADLPQPVMDDVLEMVRAGLMAAIGGT